MESEKFFSIEDEIGFRQRAEERAKKIEQLPETTIIRAEQALTVSTWEAAQFLAKREMNGPKEQLSMFNEDATSDELPPQNGQLSEAEILPLDAVQTER